MPCWTAHTNLSSLALCERVLCLGGHCEDEWTDVWPVLGTVSGVLLMCGSVSPQCSPAPPEPGSHQGLQRQVLLSGVRLLCAARMVLAAAGPGVIKAILKGPDFLQHVPPAGDISVPCLWKLSVLGSLCKLSSVWVTLVFFHKPIDNSPSTPCSAMASIHPSLCLYLPEASLATSTLLLLVFGWGHPSPKESLLFIS